MKEDHVRTPSPALLTRVELSRTQWPTVRAFLGCECTNADPVVCTGSPEQSGTPQCGPAPGHRQCSCHHIRTEDEHQEIRAAVEAAPATLRTSFAAKIQPPVIKLTVAQALELNEAIRTWQAESAAAGLGTVESNGETHYVARRVTLPCCPACQTEPTELRWRDVTIRRCLQAAFLPCQHVFEADEEALHAIFEHMMAEPS